MGKKSSSPPPPDYTGAAVAQGAANKESAIASSRLNNPNVVNPYGTQTWTENGVDGRPTLTQTLSPEEQALYNQSVETKGLLGDLGTSGATALKDVIGQNLDLSGAPAAPGSAEQTRKNAFDAIMSRVNEDTTGQRDQRNSELIAAGIRPGTKAYDDAQNQISRQYNDARQQAILASGQEGQRDFNMDTQARKDSIAETLLGRQTPLNEINALMSGSQVSNPFAMPGAAQNTNIAPAPLFGAAQAQYGANMDQYNSKQAGNSNMMGGLFSLGSAAMGNPFFFK